MLRPLRNASSAYHLISYALYTRYHASHTGHVTPYHTRHIYDSLCRIHNASE